MASKTKAAPTQQRPLLDVAGAADYSGLSERLLRRLVTENRIAFHHTSDSGKGGRLKFDPDDIDAWIASRRVEAEA